MTDTQVLTVDHEAIASVLGLYLEGSRQGKSELMKPAFHPEASFFGYAGPGLAVGTAFLFDWIDRNGAAPSIEPRIVSVDTGVRMTDRVTLLRAPERWTVRRWESEGT